MTPRCARPTWAKASPDSAHLISRVVLFLSRCLILSRGPDNRMGRAGGILPCRIFFLAPIIEATSAKKTTRSQEHVFSTSGHWDFHQRSRCCRFGGRENPVKTRFALPLLLASVAAGSFLFEVGTAFSLDSVAQLLGAPGVRGIPPPGPVASDPGVRVGTPDAGDPIAGLSPGELAFFERGKTEFEEADGIDEGLGPTMNLDNCAGCHAQPATGGTSPFTNPQVAFANANGATNRIPPFIQANGPVREARFIRPPDGTRDGGVHALFTIAGRADAPGCALDQPDFDTQLALGNVIFRIPTPVFGAGLIEQIPDKVIRANQASYAILKGVLGISGRTNHNGNDGTVARFGWKAQNKSLLLFSGEAYNVEMGITNEL